MVSNDQRRDLLKTLGAGTIGLTTVGAVGTANAAPTPIDDAEAWEYDTRKSNFSSYDYNCARVRLYLTEKHSTSDLDEVLESTAQFLDNIVAESSNLSGYLVRAFTTNVNAFYDNTSNPWTYADEYVKTFGHDQYGGGNVWIGDDGSTFGMAESNHPCGPRPYERDGDDGNNWNNRSQEFPHSFKEPVTVYDPVEGEYVTWAACHELMHQLTTPGAAWKGNYGTSGFNGARSHALAKAQYWDLNSPPLVTIMSRPGAGGWKYGDCSNDPDYTDPYYQSIQVSSCEVGAVDDCIQYAIDNYPSQ